MCKYLYGNFRSLLFFVSELAKLEGSAAINEGKIKCGLCCKSFNLTEPRRGRYNSSKEVGSVLS